MLLVGCSNVVGASDEPDNGQTSHGGPHDGHALDTQVGAVTVVTEGVSGHHSHSSLESSKAGSEKEGKSDQGDDNSLNEVKAKAGNVHQQGESSENETNDEESKGKSRQVVVGRVIADEVVGHTQFGAKVSVWRDGVGRTKVTGAEVRAVTDTPEEPFRFVVGTQDVGGVSLEPVELLEREVVHSTTQNNENHQKGGTGQQDEVGESSEYSEHFEGISRRVKKGKGLLFFCGIGCSSAKEKQCLRFVEGGRTDS